MSQSPADATPARLLFLIADTGGGHRASANAIARHFETTQPGRFDIRIVDPFVELGPRVAGRTAGLYGPIIQHVPWLWGGLYHATNSKPAVRMLRASVLRVVHRGLVRLLTSFKPTVVVSFHPLLNHITARALRRPGVTKVPLITVITDLVDVHAAWACRQVDAVVTPSPGGLDRARRAGIPAHRCYQIGLPVDASFTVPPPGLEEKHQLRRQLGLEPERFTVLVCSGADGSGGLVHRARALAQAPLPIQVAVICGRNHHAQQALADLTDRAGTPVTVRGFVNNMAEWTRAADLVVTKAGPGTIAETLCCGTPLLLNWYVPGQERGNVDWLVDVGAGRYVPHIDQMIDTVAELSEPDSLTYRSMRAAVREVAHPEATQAICDLIERFLSASPLAAR